MRRFVEFDTVRVSTLNGSAADHLSIRDGQTLPAVGDVGSIVHVVPAFDPDAPETRYIVECVGDDGYTIWLAEFARDELELMERP